MGRQLRSWGDSCTVAPGGQCNCRPNAEKSVCGLWFSAIPTIMDWVIGPGVGGQRYEGGAIRAIAGVRRLRLLGG